MKKEVIRVLIGVIAIAMIGLVASQVYWIKSAVEQRTARFNRDVRTAMINTAQRLERIETLNRLKNQQLIAWDTFPAEQNLEHYFQFKKDTTIVTPQGEVTISVEQHANNDTTINIDFGHIDLVHPHGSVRQEVFVAKMREHQEDVVITQQAFNDRVKRKMRHVDELLGGLFNSGLPQNIHDRVSFDKLDTIVQEELAARGIETNYQLGVFNRYNEPLMLGNQVRKQDFVNLSDTRFQVRLFPNDLIQEGNFLKLYFHNPTRYVLHSMWFMLSSSAVLILVIISVFWYTINTILRQKKISEIKNDFINNMTHELKTPIATIGLACEALTDTELQRTNSMVDNFVGMIKDENRRLGALVENVLKSAVLEKGDFKLKLQQVPLNTLINDVIQGMQIQAKNKGGLIHVKHHISDVTLQADPMHLTNVVYNLIDNAIKYTQDKPEILVEIKGHQQQIMVSVKDNGIGIKAENQHKIFDKLYRVPTGNVHNVKGFGLGLSYVKAIIEKHKGHIAVNSALGQGTTIMITLPIADEKGA